MYRRLISRVKRRAYIIGTLAVVLALNVAQSNGAYCKVVHSAQNFQHYYRDLEGGQSTLNPLERFVFSLVLASSRSTAETAAGKLPTGRT
jgi:hypothetical protein